MDREKVQVEACELQPFVNETWQGFKLAWTGNIGFGEYTIYQDTNNPGRWMADSEHMDTNKDKWFIKRLLESFIEKMEITE